MDTCQGAGSQPYPSGWIRILITLFGPRSFHSLNIPAVELDKLPTSASLKWRRRDYTRFFYTPTARPIGWTSSVCPRPPEFYSLPSVSVLRNTPLVVAVLTRCNFRANLFARTVKRCHWIFMDNLFARTMEHCGWFGQSLQQERSLLLGLPVHF